MNNDINFKNGPVVILEGNGSEPYHMHRNANEIIWVLEGEAGITFNNTEYTLNADDDLILLVDADAHMIRQFSDKLRYLSFYIDLPYFQNTIPDILHVGLYVNPGYRPPEQKPYLAELRKLLAHIVWEYKGDENMDHVIDLTSQVLLLLRNHFNFLGTTSLDYKDTLTFDRLFKVYDFVYQHYKERVTLADLADQIHVSRSYLSRSVKKITGMGFKDILNYVRCEEAVRQLLATDKSITTIAYDCGFSDPKYFNQYFSTFFHANPLKFRKMYQKTAEIDHLVKHQRPIGYDGELTELLDEYWSSLDLFGINPQHIPFLPQADVYRSSVELADNGPLTVCVSAEQLAAHDDLPQILKDLSQDFGAVQLQVLSAEEMSPDVTWPEALEKALKSNRIFLFSTGTHWNGLYMFDQMKTPMYFMLKVAAKIKGWGLFEDTYIVSRNREGNCLCLLGWNESSEKNLDFRIDFEGDNAKYLVLRYDFPASFPLLLDDYSVSLRQEILAQHTALGIDVSDICHPSCTAEHITVSDYGFPYRLRPYSVGFVLVYQLSK